MQVQPPDIDSIRPKYWPFTLPTGESIRAVSREDLETVSTRYFDEIFPSYKEGVPFHLSGARRDQVKPMSRLYDRVHRESFVFYSAKDEPIGWHIGDAEDMLTYYLRQTAIRPHAQAKGLYTAFCIRLSNYLADIGYERLTSCHQVTNRKMLIRKLKDGFVIAGLEITERWGPMVKLVKLLPEDRREAFYEAFGAAEHLP